MKKTALVLSSVILAAGCWSAAPDQPAANERSGTESAVNSSANVRVVIDNRVDPNAFNGNSSNIPVVNRSANNPKNPLKPRSAPDNSILKTEMNNQGDFIESRTFKSHPTLLKVERITSGKGADKTVKVYLKDGRVFDLAAEKLPNFNVMDPGNILLAVGIEPPVNGGQPGAKGKSEKEGKNK